MTKSAGFLTENNVVDAVANYLDRRGWKVSQKLKTTERGTDIIAERKQTKLFVEAKGGGSSNKKSARFKTGFSSGQKKHNIAHALLKSITQEKDTKDLIAMAFPNDNYYQKVLKSENLNKALKKLNVIVFLVSEKNDVEVIAPEYLELSA